MSNVATYTLPLCLQIKDIKWMGNKFGFLSSLRIVWCSAYFFLKKNTTVETTQFRMSVGIVHF